MKVGPTADYPVRVLRQEWEELAEVAAWYEGIFVVWLNHHVDVAFVPDVSAVTPPWDDHLLPDDFDAIATAEQARIATALLSSYVVTPNAARAGSDEPFRWPPDEPAADQVVCYVTGAEFERHATDLDKLVGVAHGKYSSPRVSDLRDRPVIAFLEQRVVASSWLNPRHALLLGRTR